MNLITTRKPRFLIHDMQEEMNRMIESAFENFGIVEPSTDRMEVMWKPAIELREENGNYEICAELPGISKEDINVEVGDDSIVIQGETKQKTEEKKGNIHRSEFKYGKFMRSISLPSSVDNSKAKAEFKEGVLKITVPKSEEERLRLKKISIEN